MRNRFAAAIVTLAVMSATIPAAAVTIFPANGGPGDAAFDDHCPSHQFLIGVAGHAGMWIDQIRIICSPILTNGTHGSKSYGPLHGGGGGSIVETTCPADSVVYGARISLYEEFHKRVVRLNLLCGSMQADRQSIVYFAGNGVTADGYGPVTQQCPSGEVASGFNGHYGQDINAIGLDCAVRTRS